MHVVCARIHFRPRWYALEKGDDMCSNIAAARDVGLLRLFHQRINTFCTVSLGETEGPQRFIRAIHIRFSTNNRLPETSFSLSVFHTKYSLSPRFSLSLSASNAIRIARDPERILDKKCTPCSSTPSTNINKLIRKSILVRWETLINGKMIITFRWKIKSV